MKRIALLVLATAAAGCAGPTINIRHHLESDIPAAGQASAISAGRFTVEDGPQDGFAAAASDLLAERLAGLPAGGSGDVLEVTGRIYVEAEDKKDEVAIRRRDAAGLLSSERIPTLVRTVKVRVDYDVRTKADGQRVGGAETRGRYVSTADPRVRGEQGLGRNDNPDRVPPMEQVVTKLLGECMDTFVRMVKPQVVEAAVQLKPAATDAGRAALKAAEAGDMQTALAKGRAAVVERPHRAETLFNFAALAEANGDLPTAQRQYEAADRAFDGKDEPTAQCLARVRKLIARKR